MNGFAHREAIGRRFGTRIAAGDAVFLAGTAGISGLPCTVTDGKRRPLGGVNRFMLLQVMKDQGWVDPRFFTTNQVKQAGWTIAPGAKQVGLQFLVSVGSDGLPLQTPETKQFHVFNAADIAGVPEIADAPKSPLAHLENAALESGFAVGTAGVRSAVSTWLMSLQGGRETSDPAGAALRVHLAAALLEVQAGLPTQSAPGGGYAAEWARSIEGNPLSFFQAVKDAEEMAAVVMSQVKSLQTDQQTEQEFARMRESVDGKQNTPNGERVMQSRSTTSARMDSIFAARAAVLAVPFADKDRVKAMGAMWYGPESIWFVPKGVDLERFKDWNPNLHYLGQEATDDILIDSFRDAMIGAGLEPPDKIEADGKWHNVHANSYPKKNKKGAYILTLGDPPTGVIKNMHMRDFLPWTYDGDLLTPEHRARLRDRALKIEVEAAKEREITQAAAAVHAGEILAQGTPATDHGYVRKKGISAEGLCQVQGSVLLEYPEYTNENGYSIIQANENYLIVPMSTAAGELRAVQAINEDGSVKCFMRGGQKKSTMLVLGAKSFDALCARATTAAVAYVEGVATGASFRAAAGAPTVVCFDAGNLETVASETAAKVPSNVLPILAVDNDQFHVERALGFLSTHLGINPHAPGGEVVQVASGAHRTRPLSLGDVNADGQWHQAAGGEYCISITRDSASDAVQSIAVEAVPADGGRKVQAKFVNSGLEAGKAAMKAFAVGEGVSRAVMAIPEFVSLVDRPTDWNDLEKREGIDAVRRVLRAVDGIAARANKQAAERVPKTNEKQISTLAR